MSGFIANIIHIAYICKVGVFPQNFKTLIVMSKKIFKIEELDALTPIKNEEN